MSAWERKTRILRDIERKAGRSVFDRDPYVKFLPLILDTVQLDWSLVARCDPASDRRIVIACYGRDPIAYEGWIGFAIIAAYSALLCLRIETWGIDVLVGGEPADYLDLPVADLFDEPMLPVLERLSGFGVVVRQVEGLRASADVYRHYDRRTSILLKMDADQVLLPGSIEAPCFTFDELMGYSGLNARHTARDGLTQLTHPEGRMRQWPPEMGMTALEWTNSVIRASGPALGMKTDPKMAMDRMRGVPWLSEGFSYLRGELAEPFCALREELVRSGLVPDWDEEAVKLALVGLSGIHPEMCRIPVLEHWEYGPETSDAATVNFRNQRSLGLHVPSILGRLCPGEEFSYLKNCVADLQHRSVMRRARK